MVRMYGFKLEGGEWFKEGFQNLFSQEWNLLRESLDLEISLQSTAPEKQSVVYTSFTNIKTEFKELRDREKCTQRFILVHSNPELHPVFS